MYLFCDILSSLSITLVNNWCYGITELFLLRVRVKRSQWVGVSELWQILSLTYLLCKRHVHRFAPFPIYENGQRQENVSSM